MTRPRASPLRLAALALAALTALASLSGPARAVDLEVTLGGGTLLPWSDGGEVGNTFGAGATLALGDLELGLAGAVVLPDSRIQARFGALWLEARYHLLGRHLALSPFALAGVGLATGDVYARGDLDPEPPRWTESGPAPLTMLGAGARYGAARGLGISLDLRLYNHTHAGINVLVGYRF